MSELQLTRFEEVSVGDIVCYALLIDRELITTGLSSDTYAAGSSSSIQSNTSRRAGGRTGKIRPCLVSYKNIESREVQLLSISSYSTRAPGTTLADRYKQQLLALCGPHTYSFMPAINLNSSWPSSIPSYLWVGRTFSVTIPPVHQLGKQMKVPKTPIARFPSLLPPSMEFVTAFHKYWMHLLVDFPSTYVVPDHELEKAIHRIICSVSGVTMLPPKTKRARTTSSSSSTRTPLRQLTIKLSNELEQGPRPKHLKPVTPTGRPRQAEKKKTFKHSHIPHIGLNGRETSWYEQTYAVLLNVSGSMRVPSFEEVIQSHEEAFVVRMLHDDEGLSNLDDLDADLIY